MTGQTGITTSTNNHHELLPMSRRRKRKHRDRKKRRIVTIQPTQRKRRITRIMKTGILPPRDRSILEPRRAERQDLRTVVDELGGMMNRWQALKDNDDGDDDDDDDDNKNNNGDAINDRNDSFNNNDNDNEEREMLAKAYFSLFDGKNDIQTQTTDGQITGDSNYQSGGTPHAGDQNVHWSCSRKVALVRVDPDDCGSSGPESCLVPLELDNGIMDWEDGSSTSD